MSRVKPFFRVFWYYGHSWRCPLVKGLAAPAMKKRQRLAPKGFSVMEIAASSRSGLNFDLAWAG
jgi:hypothetical protein